MSFIHIVGRKNSGKTTLIVELVEHWNALGYRVGTIKHTHHRHELDTPGKDSHRHREAGAVAVGILSPQMNAIFWPSSANAGAHTCYDQFAGLLTSCDIVLVEGHLQACAPKFEVWRAELGQPPYAAEVTDIRAVVSDDPVPGSVARIPRRDVATIAGEILQLSSK